jgi:uncharacterized membrane protein (DUF485 family)
MAVDWEAIERSPEFRALVASRRRFVVAWGGTVVGLTAAYVVIAYLAPDVLGADVAAPITLGFVLGVGLIVMTWVVTLAYLRKSDREWAPLERRIAAAASSREPTGRFARDEAVGADRPDTPDGAAPDTPDRAAPDAPGRAAPDNPDRAAPDTPDRGRRP